MGAPTYTYDPLSTGPLRPVYDLRRKMPDTNVAPMAAGPSYGRQTCLFSDQEYAAFLQDAGNNTLYALAAALYTVAGNRALTATYIQLTGGGSIDTRQAATLIGQRADKIMEQAVASANTPVLQSIHHCHDPYAVPDGWRFPERWQAEDPLLGPWTSLIVEPEIP